MTELQYEPLGALLDEIRTGPFGSTLHASDYLRGGIPVINPQHFRDGVIVPDPDAAVDETVSRRLIAFRLAKGDVIIARRGEMGRCAVVRSTEEGWLLGTGSVALKPGPRLIAEYLAYFLRSPGSVRALSKESVGSTMANLNQQILLALPCLSPPLTEQHRIIATIKAQFSRIDAADASLKNAKMNVKRARASVLRAAVEGRLVPTEAALARAEGRDYEPASSLLARILTERHARWARSGTKGKYKEPPKPEEESHNNLPSGWVWATVDQLALQVVDCLHSTPKFVSSGNICLDTNAMGPGVIRENGLRYVDRETFDDRNRRLIPIAGDIVFAREGTVGNAVSLGHLPVCLGQRTMLMRPSPGIVSRLMMHWIMSPLVRAQYAPLIAGSTVAHVNMADIRCFTLPLPPLAEQHRIVAEVDRRLSVLDALDATINTNIARCAKLRQSILKRAFEGKIVRPDASAAAAPQLPLFTEGPSP